MFRDVDFKGDLDKQKKKWRASPEDCKYTSRWDS